MSENLLKALNLAGYSEATPIQQKAIPPILQGRDLLGSAQTGTGKTAAFALPTLDRVAQLKAAAGGTTAIRCLVLTPTRELALQVSTSFNKYGRGTGLRYAVCFGGVSQFGQVQSIRSGVDVLVATPGRLEDLYQQKLLDLSKVELFILDEADQMLDMGFVVPIRRISKLIAAQRQTLMFSATMPREIKVLANEMLKNYVEASVVPAGTATELVEQRAFLVDTRVKGYLLRHYLKESAAFKTLVFSRTKHGADRIAKGLARAGVTAAAIHGNRSQSQRVRALEDFKKGKVAVLVATDVAARGLHISDVTHVINFDLPEVPETYVHRIGRTGRAGASGTAVSFVDQEDRYALRNIEKLIRKQIEILPTPELSEPDAKAVQEERAAFRPPAEDNNRPAKDYRPQRPEGSQPRPQPRDNGPRPAREQRNSFSAPARRDPQPHGPRPTFSAPPASPRRDDRPQPAARAEHAPNAPRHQHAPRPHAPKQQQGTYNAGRPARPHPVGAGVASQGSNRPQHGGPKRPSTHFGKSGQRKAFHRAAKAH